VVKVVSDPPWGWNRVALFGANASPVKYLNDLAEAAGEWFDEVPFSSESLAKRLGAFRTGLSQLRLASHETLPDDERTWLKDQGKEWSTVIDAAISAVEEGKPVDEVRGKVDDAVSLIVRSLQDRAKTLEGPP
jgi:hypothetical protein